MNSYTHYSSQGSLNPAEGFNGTRSAKGDNTTLTDALKNVGKTVVDILTRGNDLRVWTRQRQDQTVWYVYDPMTQRRAQFSSEADLRSWLENRYYA